MNNPQKTVKLKDRTKIVNARVSENLLAALTMASHNSHNISITEIITSALRGKLNQIEESTGIDFLELVKWENRIRKLFDNVLEDSVSANTSSISAGKALGQIIPFNIDESFLDVFIASYSRTKKTFKKSLAKQNPTATIDLNGKVAKIACNELGEFIFVNTPNQDNYIHIKGLEKNSTLRTVVAQYLKEHPQVLAYDTWVLAPGETEILLVWLKEPENPNFERVFEAIKAEIYNDVSKYNTFEALLSDKENQLKQEWNKAFASNESRTNNDLFKDIDLEIGDWSNYLFINETNNILQSELKQFRTQQSLSRTKGYVQTLERMKTLLAVNLDVNLYGSLCTELVMEDESRLYMKTSSFDKDLSITSKAQSMIGRKVKTSSWNPINEPRKWSKHDSFTNIYELSDFDQVNEVIQSKKNATILPPRQSWFKALQYSSFANTKVIVLGQDPYHGEGQADGLSFSVTKGMVIPPSLKNIFKELESDYVDFTSPNHGNLESWAHQGVLLLNSALTVEKNSPSSHANIGWEYITDRIIRALNDNKENLVFMLWGLEANKKIDLIDTSKHMILSATHPSPFSATKSTKDLTRFVGCKHFSKANDYLKKNNIETINWSIPK